MNGKESHSQIEKLVSSALDYPASYDGGMLEDLETECANLTTAVVKLISLLVESNIISLRDIDKIAHGSTYKFKNT